MKYSAKVFLMGGLGNNLFQFARAIDLKKNNYEVEVFYLSNRNLSLLKIIGHTVREDFHLIKDILDNLNIKHSEAKMLDLIKLFFIYLKKQISLKPVFDMSKQHLKEIKKKILLMQDIFSH